MKYPIPSMRPPKYSKLLDKNCYEHCYPSENGKSLIVVCGYNSKINIKVTFPDDEKQIFYNCDMYTLVCYCVKEAHIIKGYGARFMIIGS